MKHFPPVCTALLTLAFLLGSCKGYLALWEEPDPEPKQIYPVKIDTLPQADQTLLETGIRVWNLGELNRLLEDYLS